MGSRVKNNTTLCFEEGMIAASSSSRKNSSFTFPKYRGIAATADVGKTPGTTSSRRSIKSFVIVALVEGRGSARGEIGLASMDALCSHINLCQFIDSASYAHLRVQLEVVDPVEVIVPETTFERGNSMNAIIELIRNGYPNVEVTTVNRRFFSDVKGAELVQQLGSVESSNITPEVLSKYYCMSAVAALIKYVEFIQNVLFAQSSIKIIYHVTEKACFIDVNTLRDVEVVERLQQGVKDVGRSLYAVLNTCRTGGGVRMLRSSLLQPSSDVDVISARCDAIEELLGNQPKMDRLRAIVANAYDIQQLVTICCYLDNSADTVRLIEQKITQVLNLKLTLHLIEPLKTALEGSRAEIFQICSAHLRDPRFDMIMKKLNSRLNSASGAGERSALANRYKRCYAVKSGHHVMVDVARRGYEELVHDTEEKAEEEMADLPGARLVFTAQRGFHIQVPCADPLSEVKLPHQFIQAVRNRSSISCTTWALVKYNDRINGAVNEIMVGSNLVILQLLEEIRPLISCLYQIIEVFSIIDFITCLAAYAMKVPAVRPTFSASNAMVVKQGRHPLLDFICDEVVANDTYLSLESRLAIITGPNMAGKSTYLKQVCLLQVLAQTGSFVPAEFAAFPLVTRIFARIGHNDDLTGNLSTFALEMSEMASILATADSSSLVVVDELARSTATEEGVAICYAICEELLRIKAYVVFATHFLDLSSLAVNYVPVENYHFSATTMIIKEEDGTETETLKTNHQLYKGPYRGPLYGFNLVELSTFPEEVVANAREIAENMHASKQVVPELIDELKERRALLKFGYKLHSMLPVLVKSELTAASKYLCNLRDQLLNELPRSSLTSELRNKSGDKSPSS